MRFNDLGERALLARIASSAGTDTGIQLDVALVVADFTLTDDSFVLGDFTEMSNPPSTYYSRKSTTSWSDPGTSSGISSIVSEQVLSWVSDGSHSDDVYGYLLLDYGTDDVFAAQKFVSPITVDTLGQVLRIIPALALSDEED